MTRFILGCLIGHGITCGASIICAHELLGNAPLDESSQPDAAAESSNLYPGFDGYARKVTTDSPEAQRWFDQGIQLLYGYNHDEAIRSFEKAAELDPSCAMAWWGSAYARGLHINNPEMSKEQSRLAHEAAQKAVAALDDQLQQAWARADVKPVASCYCHPDALLSP